MSPRLASCAALLAIGCTVDPSVNPAFRDCASDAECGAGLRCDRGFCVSSASDGGGDDAASVDAGHDAGELDGAVGPDGGCGEEIVCNGVDDDCDDATDEFAVDTCDTGSPGICGDGSYVCSGGGPVCAATTFPRPEACDGRDDDCDDAVDELAPVECYPTGTVGCADADGDGRLECAGTCRPGTAACTGGALAACEGFVAPAAEETCAGVPVAGDEDCDGTIDEGCDCTADQACYGGPDGTRGVGVCVGGTQACMGGALDPSCVGQVLPAAETCANAMADDDCNGAMDDIPGLGDPCVAAGAIGRCQLGTLGCGPSDPALVCQPGMPGLERCDGNDDDCDRGVDEGFDLSSDEANCGACGVACGSDEVCCAGACVDPRMSSDHCGACALDGGDQCGAAEVCCNGTCADAASCGSCMEDCAAMGRDCCRGACVDQDVDESHCGACGNACAAGQVCCGGACVASDASHCGQTCGVCAAGSELCCSGSCVAIGNTHCNACGVACATGECCADGCVDLQTDRDNCGSCGDACPASQVCSQGNCCPSGQSWCAGQSACRDLANDTNNCGACGNRCGVGSRCCGGTCRLLSLGC